jgi:ABC-type transport system involved in multi-copper enzyme maturation permease subunit
MSATMMPVTTAPAISGNRVTQTWRLAGWFLHASRRRLMSKVLLGILLGGLVLVLGFVLIAYVATSNNPPQSQVCPPAVVQTQAAQNGGANGPSCFQMSQQELAQARDQWQQQVNAERQNLTFPDVLSVASGYTGFMGLILLIILAGSIVGGEYSSGTIRLSLARGVGRGQLIAAQVLALAMLALIAMGLTLAIAIILGLTVGPALGGKLPAFPVGGMLELVGFWIVLSFQIFAYALIGLFMGTLARSTAAAIAVPLGFYIFETLVGGILIALSFAIGGSFGDFLKHVPDWFLGNNVGTLSTNVAQSPVKFGDSASGAASPLSTGHALLVSLAYCVVLVGLSYLILRRRDITD